MIELRNLSFGFTDAPLFQGISMRIQRHEVLFVKGRSGCGKTSFLRLLSRFLLPAGGELFLDGHPYENIGYDKLRSHVILVQQGTVLESDVSVYENLIQPFSFHAHRGKTAPTQEELMVRMRAFHLDSKILKQKGGSLSAGEGQRVAIIRACMLKPDFMLLDEPLANLDAESSLAIQPWIGQQSHENTGLIIAGHQSVERLSHDHLRMMEIRDGGLYEQRA